MLGKYILKGKTPVAEPDVLKWAEWFETHDKDRQVAVTELKNGKVLVSTVFLGLDHNFTGHGQPLLFETMIFGGKHDQEQIRTTSWAKAESAHKYMVEVANE